MSTIKTDTLQNVAGTQSVPVATVAQGSAKAWVNFNGTTSPGTIRASFNVSSVTRNGTGDYTANFTTAMPDANYCVQHSFGNSGVDVADSVRLQVIKSMTSSAVRSYLVRSGLSSINWEFMSVTIFR